MKRISDNIEELISQLSETLETIKSLSETDKVAKNKSIIENIYYYNALTDKIEDRRTKIQDISYQYLLILLTVLGVLFSFKESIPYMEYITITTCIYIQIIATSAIITVFLFQSNFKYPFLELNEYSNQWKWFYYGNEKLLNLKTIPFKTQNIEKSNKIFIESLTYFSKKYLEENINSEIESNLIQLHLLQVHNYYKNKFYMQLMTIRKWGLYIVIDVIIAYTVAKIVLTYFF